jgi:hypothetical protein
MWTTGSCGVVLVLLLLVPSGATTGAPRCEPLPRVVRWQVGQERVRLMRAADGFCFLSAVGGGFAGGGEWVRVAVDDGWWYLSGHCLQPELWAEATCVDYRVVGR